MLQRAGRRERGLHCDAVYLSCREKGAVVTGGFGRWETSSHCGEDIGEPPVMFGYLLVISGRTPGN